MTRKHRQLYEARLSLLSTLSSRFFSPVDLLLYSLQSIIAKCVQFHGRAPAPVRVVFDYEMAILRAMAIAFPNAQARGCWFHSSQVRNGNLNINDLNT